MISVYRDRLTYAILNEATQNVGLSEKLGSPFYGPAYAR